MYTDLCLRVRGDGRTYMINVQTNTDFDAHWDDLWHYPLYTRGGPYWQEYKIPFSKFYFAAQGKIQDEQGRDSPNRFRTLSGFCYLCQPLAYLVLSGIFLIARQIAELPVCYQEYSQA
jgi:hypothetical protein